MRPERVATVRKAPAISDWRTACQRAVPKFIFDYIEGGGGGENALHANLEAFRQWNLVPRILLDVSAPRQNIDLFGASFPSPVIVAPTGLNGVVRPGGDVAIATAARDLCVPFCLSTAANATVAEVRQRCGVTPWFQLYVPDRDFAELRIQEAERAGCPVLMLTVDVPVGGNRLRDRRNGFGRPLNLSPSLIADIVQHPAWALRHLRAPSARRLATHSEASGQDGKMLARQFDASIDWEYLARLRDRWDRSLVVKGVLRPEDAERAARLGVDGLVVSNHGGRQLDSAPAALDALPWIARAVGSRVTVLFDGGVRSGEDVLKAIALGACAVLVGRPVLYGLAADGYAGVMSVLGIFRDELQIALSLLGAATAAEVDASFIRRRPWPEWSQS
jgi:(S)-mandelate dehydrogenase